MNDDQCNCGGADHHADRRSDGEKMKTPLEIWEEYRDFVYVCELDEGTEQERMRAFFAGSEAVFRLLDSIGRSDFAEYRAANKAAALESLPPEDRLIAEIELKSALGEID